MTECVLCKLDPSRASSIELKLGFNCSIVISTCLHIFYCSDREFTPLTELLSSRNDCVNPAAPAVFLEAAQTHRAAAEERSSSRALAAAARASTCDPPGFEKRFLKKVSWQGEG